VPSPTPPALRDALRAIGRQVFLRIAAAPYHPPPDQPEQALKAEKAAATTKTIVKVLVTKRR
jgi:hypothetical protein